MIKITAYGNTSPWVVVLDSLGFQFNPESGCWIKDCGKHEADYILEVINIKVPGQKPLEIITNEITGGGLF